MFIELFVGFCRGAEYKEDLRFFFSPGGIVLYLEHSLSGWLVATVTVGTAYPGESASADVLLSTEQ